MRKCLKALMVCLTLALMLLPAMAMAMAAPSKTDKASKGNEAKKPAEVKTVKKTEPVIRVGLAEERSAAVFKANNDFVIRDGAGKGLRKATHKDTITISVKNRQLVLNGKAISAKKLIIKPAVSQSSTLFSYNDSQYRGEFEVILTTDGLTVVNVVKLDDYVGGVLNEEMSDGWPAEALKAQAVAARTFALYTKDEGKHEEDGYDVCATTHCQAYGGVDSESRSALEAVSFTRGEVMTYGGKPIYAAFHGSSGGRTAGSEETGANLPYLKSRLDWEDEINPNQEWKVSVSVTTLTQKLKAAGFNVGTLKSIELSPLDMEEGKPGKDRYTSLRVKSVKFVGSLKTVEVPGTKLRWTFGLHSTLFDIRPGSGKTLKSNKTGKIDVSGKSSNEVTFTGRGWGHGLGLSQWGAYGMAQKPKNKYRDILARYYTDVTIQKLY